MDHKLKVIHVIGGGEFGGAEQHIIQLLSLMPRHQVKGKVICFYEAGLSKALRDQGVDVEVLHFGRFDFRLISGLRKVFSQEQPDIIHTHGVKANFFARLAARTLKSTPLVTTIHSLLRFDYIHRLAYAVASSMERYTRSMNDHFIAVSHAIKSSLMEEGITSKEVTVVHHGIDFKRYSQGEGSLRTELALPEEAYVIGVVTRLVKIKGMEFIIGAMPRILENNPMARLVIVGTGPEEADLKQLVVKLGLKEKVIFAGFRDDVGSCLSSFDSFVSASLSEGLGLNVLEAMAASIPVVATKVGGILDFVKDRENGLLVEPSSSAALSSAIIELMDDPERSNQFAQAAKRLVEREYSPDKMSLETVRVYEKLLGGPHV
jgi:glycosyltransferase involved in cell wall biosynthesis